MWCKNVGASRMGDGRSRGILPEAQEAGGEKGNFLMLLG